MDAVHQPYVTISLANDTTSIFDFFFLPYQPPKIRMILSIYYTHILTGKGTIGYSELKNIENEHPDFYRILVFNKMYIAHSCKL
jgi:hypothetical protein